MSFNRPWNLVYTNCIILVVIVKVTRIIAVAQCTTIFTGIFLVLENLAFWNNFLTAVRINPCLGYFFLLLLSFPHQHLTFSVDDHHMLCETEKRNKKEERAQEWWVYFFIFEENNVLPVSGQKWLKHLFHPLTFSFLDISRFFTYLKQCMFYLFKYFAIINISSINSII